MADSTVSIGADLSALRRDLAKLPNLSADAAQKTLIQVERAVASAEKAAKKAAKSISKANKAAAKDAGKAAEETEKALKGLYELAGGSGEEIEKLSSVLTALSNPAVLGAVAVAGVGAAAVGAVAGVAMLVSEAEELAAKLEPLQDIEGFGVPPESLESIQAANSAMAGLASVGQQVVVILGAEFAPAVEQVATVLLKLALIGMDTFQAFADGQGILREVAVFMVDRMVKAILAPVTSLMTLIDAMGSLAGALGADEISAKLKGVTADYDAFTRSVAGSAVDFYFDEASAAVSKLDKVTGNYDDRAQALIGTLTSLRNATNKGTEANKAALDVEAELLRLAGERAKAEETAAAIVSGLTDHRRRELEKLAMAEEEAIATLIETEVATAEQLQAVRAEFAQRRMETVDEIKAHTEKVRAAEVAAEKAAAQEILQTKLAALEQYRSASANAAGAVMSLAGMVKDYQIAQGEEASASQKATARDAFRVEQAAAIAQAGLNTAAAIMKGIAMFGPPPSPPGIAAIAAASITGGIQIAKIASTAPPKFHIGGSVGADPSERQAIVRAGEYVSDPAQVANQGGPAAMDNARSRAMGNGTTIVLENQIRGRTQDRVFHELQGSGGAVTRATRSTRPSLATNPYGA